MADSFSTRITKAWFDGDLWPKLLLPLTLVFWIAYLLRKLMFRLGLKKTYSSQIPVVIVGNI